MRWMMMLSCAACLSACVATTTTQSPTSAPAPQPKPQSTPKLSPAQAKQNFAAVMRSVEPVAERECRARAKKSQCDFKIYVDTRPGLPPNAYQTLDASGRPVLAFTSSLLAMARNRDEIAFVMGHEAAHHIRNHIARQKQNAIAGAILAAGLASLAGSDASGMRTAQDLGAAVGARSYSKNFELEADELGTIIAKHAGFDPVRGALFFNRIPDPGDRFLGTHPPNKARMATVRKTAAKL